MNSGDDLSLFTSTFATFVLQVRLQRSTGRFLAADSGEAASVESVASAISSITEFDLATVIHDKNILAQLQALDIDGISAGTYPTNAGDALRSVLISKGIVTILQLKIRKLIRLPSTESEKNPKAVAARKQTEKEEIVAAKTQKLASDEIFFAIEDYFKGNHRYLKLSLIFVVLS